MADKIEVSPEYKQKAVEQFCEYLRILTVQPRPDYAGAVDFLRKLCIHYGFEDFFQVEDKPGKPICWMRWEGTDPSLPSVLLNSHMDVVPASAADWIHDPWSGTLDAEGWIHGRGTQDMKSVGIQYLAALGALRAAGKRFARTIYCLFVPDEEIGGHDGMQDFCLSEHFKGMNVAVALDEGLASPTDAFTVFYGEREAWWIAVTATGPTGHGSRFVKHTAMEKINRVCNHLLAFRAEQEKILLDAESKSCAHARKTLGDVTTVNLTFLQGGVTQDGGKTFAINVIPQEARAGFDIRIPPHISLVDFEKQLNEWTNEEGVSYKRLSGRMTNTSTDLSGENVWWTSFRSACQKLDITVQPEIFPAATDSRYIRALQIPAFGFSPMNNTPILLHDHNERLHSDVFKRGIDIYVVLIETLANTPQKA